MIEPTERKLRTWLSSGEPWVWLNAAAVGVSIAAVLGVLLLIAVRGLSHFWPKPVLLVEYRDESGSTHLLGELADTETIPASQYRESAGAAVANVPEYVERWLIKTGNRKTAPPDFRWIFVHGIQSVAYPQNVSVVERTEWGNAYGWLLDVKEGNSVVASGDDAFAELRTRLARVASLRNEAKELEDGAIGGINYELDRVRLERRRLELDGGVSANAAAAFERRETALREQYAFAEAKLRDVHRSLARDSVTLQRVDGGTEELNLSTLIGIWQPNAMTLLARLRHFAASFWSFLTEDPREANTEGGIFPAIFGTVMMVLLMSVIVTPFGVIAALYLREYARQGVLVRLIRIAVNNLAGVPSIVYGVFGLGFFVYFLGGSIDELFYPEALPAPTFGTPGLIWASLTLALLTVPVVIVSTEEGLTRIPRALREGSLALGATKAETLFRVVLPMATPSILTGTILAVARAAGEVAPLMLVGVVKLAPTLPVDGNFPFVHLERKFMHLGFHIYDVGFQSPNVDAARPLVFATALLLVVIIVSLNLTAIMLRTRLEARYRAVE
jgi:phosphate transport system permease protein